MGKTLNNIKKICALIILLSVLMTSGCVQVKRTLEFKHNGSVNVTYEMNVKENFIKTAYNSVDEFYENMQSQLEGSSMADFDFEKVKTTMDDSNAYGYILRGKLPKEYAAAPLNNGKIKTNIAISGIIVKEIKISISSLRDPSSDSDNSTYSQYLKSGIVDELNVKVPGKIMSTNGFKDSNDARMVTWDISDVEFGETMEKELVVSYLDTRMLVLPVVAIIILALLIVILVVVIKKKNSASMSVSI